MSKVSVIRECLADMEKAPGTQEILQANQTLGTSLRVDTIKELLDVVELADEYLKLPDNTPQIRRTLARNVLERAIAKVMR